MGLIKFGRKISKTSKESCCGGLLVMAFIWAYTENLEKAAKWRDLNSMSFDKKKNQNKSWLGDPSF